MPQQLDFSDGAQQFSSSVCPQQADVLGAGRCAGPADHPVGAIAVFGVLAIGVAAVARGWSVWR